MTKTVWKFLEKQVFVLLLRSISKKNAVLFLSNLYYCSQCEWQLYLNQLQLLFFQGTNNLVFPIIQLLTHKTIWCNVLLFGRICQKSFIWFCPDDWLLLPIFSRHILQYWCMSFCQGQCFVFADFPLIIYKFLCCAVVLNKKPNNKIKTFPTKIFSFKIYSKLTAEKNP